MRNKWIKAALLTATLASLAAPSLAQRGGDNDGNGRGRGGGESRGGGEARGGGDRGGDRGVGRANGGFGERGSGFRQQQQQQAAPAVTPQPPRVMDNPRGDGRFSGRPGTGAGNAPQPGQPTAPAVRNDNRGWSGNAGNTVRNDRDRGDRDGRPGVRGDNRGDNNDWRDRDRNDRDRDWRDRDNRGNGWRGNDGRGNDWRGNDRNNRDRDWNRPNGGRPPIVNRWQGYRPWTNDWRRDNRYNWQGWRNSHRDIFRLPRYYAPSGWSRGYYRFSLGSYLDTILFGSSYWIDDPYRYRLPPAYGTLRWVRYYDDALLIDIRDGYVVDVEHDVFW